MRVGLRTELKSIWAGPEQAPIGKMSIRYRFFYLYAALNPFTGHLFALFLPNMKRVCMDIFLQHLRIEYDIKYPERREEEFRIC